MTGEEWGIFAFRAAAIWAVTVIVATLVGLIGVFFYLLWQQAPWVVYLLGFVVAVSVTASWQSIKWERKEGQTDG